MTTRNPNDRKNDDEDGEESNEEESETEDLNKKDEAIEVVFLFQEGKAKMVEVETGISDFENIEILSGIEKGDKIIKGPFIAVSKRLKDGDLVVEKEGSAKKKGEDIEAAD